MYGTNESVAQSSFEIYIVTVHTESCFLGLTLFRGLTSQSTSF